MSIAKDLEKFIDNLGLRYFSGKELTPLWSRMRTARFDKHGLVKSGESVVNGVPPRNLWTNIVEPLVVLDEVRHKSQNSIYLTSTYRSPKYNAAVEGAQNSNHMQFAAIDFHATGQRVSPRVLAKLTRSMRGKLFTNPLTKRPFIFLGGIGLYKSFVHLDARQTVTDW
jgi:hypothetical protein